MSNKSDQQGDHASPEDVSSILKEKFLFVAKEKANLEAIILEQNDIIFKLEKDNAILAKTIGEYTEANKKIKEKLHDFDILRNTEIAELKDKITALFSENKKLAADKDLILTNLKRDNNNILMDENQKLEASLASTAKLDISRLSNTVGELKDLLDIKEFTIKTSSERIQQLEQELSSIHVSLKDVEGERNHLHNQLEELSAELGTARQGKMFSEEELEQEIDIYSKEILSLKSDTEVLTSSIKEKSYQIDTLNEKAAELSKLLTNKEIELRETIPLLRIKIQQLSSSIDKKMEENSLFAKELADLNDKLSALSDELVQRDEFVLEISEDYKREKGNWDRISQEYESTIKQIEAELASVKSVVPDLQAESTLLLAEKKDLETDKNQLKAEIANLQTQLDNLRADDTEMRQRVRILEDEKQAFESKFFKALQHITDLEINKKSNLAALESKDHALLEVNAEILDLKADLASLGVEKQGFETAKNQLDAEIANLQAQIDNVCIDDTEISQRVRTLEDEKQAHEFQLSVAMKRITDLETDMQSNLAALESKDHVITESNTEIADLKADLVSLGVEKQGLETAKNRLEVEIANLQAQIDNVCIDDTEISQRVRTLEDEKLALEFQLSVAMQRITDLETDMQSNLAALESKDHVITESNTEIADLKADLASLGVEKQGLKTANNQLDLELTDLRAELAEAGGLRNELASLKSEKQNIEVEKTRIEDKLARSRAECENIRNNEAEYRQVIDKSENEKRVLEYELSNTMQKITGLEEEISRHVSAFTSNEQVISDLRTETENYRAAIESLREENTNLENRLSERKQEFSRDSAEQPANIVPTVICRTGKVRPGLRYALYIAIFFAIVTALSYFTTKYQPSIVIRNRPPVNVNADENLGYREIYDRNTVAAASKNIKVQATIITESLLRKEGTAEFAGFDFNKNIYFKVHINSLGSALSQSLIQNPLDSLKLTEDLKVIEPLGYKQIDKIKIFYKKLEPTTVTFYCAFPKDALGPDRKNLTLTLSNSDITIPLTWDFRTLIDNKI